MKTPASLVFGVGMLTLVATAQERAPMPTALHFGHVWDGSRLMDNVTLLLDETKIVAVAARVSVPKGAIEVDLRRYTAIPGLIDLHTHITRVLRSARPEARCRPSLSGGPGTFRSPATPNCAWSNEA